MLKFKKSSYISLPKKESSLPEGLWIKCDGCGQMLYKEDVVNNHYSCYKCGKYFRLSTRKRIRLIADKGSFQEWDTGIENADPLGYPDYPEKITSLKERWKLDEAVTTGLCTIHGEETAVSYTHLGSDMGYRSRYPKSQSLPRLWQGTAGIHKHKRSDHMLHLCKDKQELLPYG